MTIKGLEFREFIGQEEIQDKIRSLASQINAFYEGRCPVFLPVLNGAFMFASDLLRDITVPCKVSFVKMSSYEGMHSTGQFRTLIGLEESLFHQDVVIIEDIVDTSLTLEKIIAELKDLGAKSVEVASLLRKAPAREKNIAVRFAGFEIDRQFVLGYGLDYEGLGRNYPRLFEAVLRKEGKNS